MKTILITCTVLLVFFYGCQKDNGTCDDGIQNQGETGIDCGGPCPDCLSERDKVIADYHDVYLASYITDPGWTGNIANCNAGSVPQSTHDKVIARINYFRRLVGLNDNTTLVTNRFDDLQETALMMKANGQLDHYPPNTWNCWTQAGADGASKSNLHMMHSTPAITGFIEDPGANNADCGHRRWILHSEKTKFSYGTTNSSMALEVIGSQYNGNTQIPEFIAYPPEGYVPQELVFPRWSFGIPKADFSTATVTMTGPDGNIMLDVVSRTKSYGDKTIVWEPQGIITNSSSDLTYTVTISGIGNAPQTTYTYSTILIQP